MYDIGTLWLILHATELEKGMKASPLLRESLRFISTFMGKKKGEKLKFSYLAIQVGKKTWEQNYIADKCCHSALNDYEFDWMVVGLLRWEPSSQPQGHPKMKAWRNSRVNTQSSSQNSDSQLMWDIVQFSLGQYILIPVSNYEEIKPILLYFMQFFENSGAMHST